MFVSFAQFATTVMLPVHASANRPCVVRYVGIVASFVFHSLKFDQSLCMNAYSVLSLRGSVVLLTASRGPARDAPRTWTAVLTNALFVLKELRHCGRVCAHV